MNDVISRQAAIDVLRDAENHAFNSYYQGFIKAHKIIADLPSAQSEHMVGKWIGHTTCSVCGCEFIDDIGECAYLVAFNYCPNCGADMRGDTE